MYSILQKEQLNTTVVRLQVVAPLIAAKAQAGQFVILRVDEEGERIPLTIADFNPVEGTVSLIFQIVGATTAALSRLEVGDRLADLVGPLGRPTETEGLSRVVVVGGGVGCAIAYPVAKKLWEQGAEVYSITGFRNKELVILQDEFAAVSHTLVTVTDDGSFGEKGLVTDALDRLIESGVHPDRVIAIGPLPMMKYVCKVTEKYSISTVVSMNPIMIDGTGMCGGCRLTVGGKVKFACVDGPEFDGHQVDFDEAMRRSGMYYEAERHAYEDHCNLFQKEVR